MKKQRVVENLNAALHRIFEEDDRVFLLGEDLLDPYGGAFKVSKGLSTKYPDRVLTTPLSESGFVGVAAGLSMMGNRPIVEIMFGDFAALGFDQILNFLSKSVTMYGQKVELDAIIRVTVGGNRSYGPTHSQCLQKHFVGIPNLDLFEITPFHDNYRLFSRMISLGHPAMVFEDKILYTQTCFREGVIDDLFRYDFLGPEQDYARVFSPAFDRARVAILTPGGVVHRAIEAARRLFLENEIECVVLTPARLYPFDVEPIMKEIEAAEFVFVAEEGTAGGSWGTEVAAVIHDRLWQKLKRPVQILTSKDSIIPSAPHLERTVLLQAATIHARVAEVIDASAGGSKAQRQR